MRITSEASLHGFYRKPRVSKNYLAKHARCPLLVLLANTSSAGLTSMRLIAASRARSGCAGLNRSGLWVTDHCWPEFQEADLHQAIRDFAARDRRFGGLSE